MEPFIPKYEESFMIQTWMENNPGLVAGFSTRIGGVSQSEFSGLNFGFHVGDEQSAVRENRELLARKIGVPISSWVGAQQAHEIHIQKVAKEDRGKGAKRHETSVPATDGFYTAEKGLLLTLVFADCVPLYFFDQEQGLIGLAHAGWKGTVGGIGREMISYFAQNGSKTEEISAVIGPSICKKCYIVDERVINLVDKILEGVEKKPYNQIITGQYSLDLKKLNKQILINSGMKEANILETDYCTRCNNKYFYSHRRDQGNTGRMLAFIGWKEDFHL